MCRKKREKDCRKEKERSGKILDRTEEEENEMSERMRD